MKTGVFGEIARSTDETLREIKPGLLMMVMMAKGEAILLVGMWEQVMNDLGYHPDRACKIPASIRDNRRLLIRRETAFNIRRKSILEVDLSHPMVVHHDQELKHHLLPYRHQRQVLSFRPSTLSQKSLLRVRRLTGPTKQPLKTQGYGESTRNRSQAQRPLLHPQWSLRANQCPPQSSIPLRTRINLEVQRRGL
jgi:hypothetical protein